MSRITGLTREQHSELKKLMSYKIDAKQAYFSGTYHTHRSLLGARGDFPTGLLYIAECWAQKNRLYYEGHDNRVRALSTPGLFKMDLKYPPYQEQVEAANACTFDHRGIISAPTGVGKSAIAGLIVNNLQVRTLIVVPSLELKRQLTETMKEMFPTADVGGLGADLAVENVDALSPKEEMTNYGCVLVDEFHHSGAKTYRTLNKKAWKNIYYRFGLTATPFRSNENERLLLESVLSEVIYRIDYKEAVSKGYIVPMEAYYVDIPLTKTEGHTWRTVYRDLVVNNLKRDGIIVKLLDNLEIMGKSTLCLVKEVQHGQNLHDARLTAAGLFATGDHEDPASIIAEFNSSPSRSLIATTGICGEGVDTKPAEFVIIAGLGKSKNAFMQQVGRGFRKYPGKESCKVILFRDESHKWTLAHFNAQVKYLREEYGVKPVKLEIA